MLRKSLVILAFIGLSSNAQTYYNGFEDGTPEGWEKPYKSQESVTVTKDTYNYLEAHFTNSEEVALVNRSSDYWAGNYFIATEDHLTIRTIDDILLSNPNDFDLHIRYGFKGRNGVEVVTTTPIVVKAHSDWDAYSNYYAVYFEDQILDNLTIVSDMGTKSWGKVMDEVKELFEDVEEFKIFHNPEIAYRANATEAVFRMESIVSFEEISRPTPEMPELSIAPNPFVNKVSLSSDRTIERIVVYNAQGAKVLDQTINDVSCELTIGSFNSGLYLFEIHYQDGSLLSKQLVKQ